MSDPRLPMIFPEWSAFGPKMAALRTDRERRFVWAFLMNTLNEGQENATQAARDAGYPDTGGSVRVRAHELMHREDVLEAMHEVAARELRGLAVPAVVALSRLIRKGDHTDHLKAVDMVLKRVGFSERTAIDVNVNGSVQVNHTDAALEDLRRLKALGVPREKLIEAFGFSGLDRYEKMLASDPKLIEGEVVK